MVSDILLVEFFMSEIIPNEKVNRKPLCILVFLMVYSLIWERFETFKLVLKI